MGNFKDLTGQKFGRLEVISPAFSDKYNHWHWLCKCDCGNEKTVYGVPLTRGKIRSCGCLRKEQIIKRQTIHGLSHSRLDSIRGNMIQRCYNTKDNHYKDYGGRGITVCDTWRESPKIFFEWAQNNGYKEDLTIDRIDNNGNYCPENCRWITRKEQSSNQRLRVNTKYITYNGETKTYKEWSNLTGLNINNIKSRLFQGWSIERTLSTPPRKKNKEK